MKHFLKAAFVLPLALCAAGLAACGEPGQEEPTPGGEPQAGEMQFAFRLNYNGESYTVYTAAGVDKEAVTEIVVPAEHEGLPVTSIDQEAFSGFTYVTSITLPETIRSIGPRAFSNCHSLLRIELPDAMSSLGSYAFAGCDSLLSVTVGESYSLPPAEVFRDCEKLVEVYNRSDLTLTPGDTQNGYVAYYAKNVYDDPADSNLKEEGDFIFYDDGSERCLMAYTGDSVDVMLPDGAYEIYTGAMRYSSKVKTVTVPDAAEVTIGDEAFANCKSLKALCFGNGIESLGADIAEDSPVNEILIDDLAAWCAVEKEGAISAQTGYGPINLYSNGAVVYDLEIPDGVKEIKAWSFADFTGLRTLTLADSVSHVRDNAFNGCCNLYKVTLGESANYFYSNAFNGCRKLYEIENNSVEAGLDLELPKVPDGSDSSNGCLTAYARNIYVPLEGGESKIRTTEEGYIYYASDERAGLLEDDVPYGTSLLAYIGTETQLILPESFEDSVYHIADCAFYGNQQLESVNISSGVYSVGAFAFEYCANLSEVTLVGGNLQLIGDRAFAYAAISEVRIPGGVDIGDYAFGACPIETVVLDRVFVHNLGANPFGTDPYNAYLGDTKEEVPVGVEEALQTNSNTVVYYYSETEPAAEGNYWHYVNDVPAAW